MSQPPLYSLLLGPSPERTPARSAGSPGILRAVVRVVRRRIGRSHRPTAT